MTWQHARRDAARLAAAALTLALAAPGPASATGEHAEAATLLAGQNVCAGPDLGFGASGLRNNGDLAFWGNRAIVACGADNGDLRDDGFAVVNISDPRRPKVLGRFACVASASDVAVWGDLVFLAVDANNDTTAPHFAAPTGPDCNALTAPRNETTPWYGIRVVDISDPTAPRKVADLRVGGTGVHNISVVPGAGQDRLLLYLAAAGHTESVIAEVNLENPSDVKKVGTIQGPTGDPRTDQVPQEDVSPQGPAWRGCHDISVFMPRKLAACHALGNGTWLFDITDPRRPERTGVIPNRSVGRNDHSGAFSWDGNTLVVTDENASNLGTSSCQPAPSSTQGVLWFFDVSNPRAPEPRGYGAPQLLAGRGWCYPKQVSVVPLPGGRDVATVSWGSGGTSVVDFTDVGLLHPARHIARYVPPFGPEGSRAFVWASYWYNGHVFANQGRGCAYGAACIGDATRGLDVVEVGAPELDGAVRLNRFNAGTQECVARVTKC